MLLPYFVILASKALSLLLCANIASAKSSSQYWLANIKRQGTVPFTTGTGYPIYRNVQDYGATGDGVTDDTAAINQAISTGNRCGQGCDSSTTTPALIYFPPGTYLVSSPIVMYYFSQLVGDALNMPIIKAASTFNGPYVVDSDVYIPGGFGSEWYTNQNNFYRQVRNFVIDITSLSPTGNQACIHWQVAQATSLQNIVFQMLEGVANNTQVGIFMENGSGGFMTDLVFIGGYRGAFLGNQQFTSRNMTFTGCNTAIYMNFDWVWTFKSLTITNCKIGIDMSNGGTDQLTTGSVVVLDSTISASTAGIMTNYIPGYSSPGASNTLVVENVDFRRTNLAITNSNGAVILQGGIIVASFAQGNAYTTAGEAVTGSTTFNGTACTYSNTTQTAYTALETTIQKQLAPIAKPANLQGRNGYFERSKPQYETYQASSFLSAKSFGCVGDGVVDDTACVQAFFNQASSAGQIAYFDHGAFKITDTVLVPTQLNITGEVYSMIMASGFKDQNNPKPVFQVGRPGSIGNVEMTDLVFETIGPNPGAILIEWNIAEASPGSVGMWDVHWRIGGSAGTQLQSDTCSKDPNVTTNANPNCEGAFLLLHVTIRASIYLENNWAWVADHELDRLDHNQLNIFNGRGMLIESENGPVWMYGTSSEHSVLYNYQFSNANNIYAGHLQTETAYFQANPNALQPFTIQSAYTDPTFSRCTTPNCYKTWGLRVVNCTNNFTYGSGFYSFFDNYDQSCLDTESCNLNMIDVMDSTDIYLWAVSTKASSFMVTYNGYGVVSEANNLGGFCENIVLFEAVST